MTAMAKEQDTAGWRFYMRQIELLQAENIEELLATHYTDDGQLIAVDWSVQGHGALRQAFKTYLESIGSFTVETEKFHETDDSIFFEATMNTEKAGVRKVYDAFVFRDGKISHHFTGVR
jgi:hypothetical protein